MVSEVEVLEEFEQPLSIEEGELIKCAAFDAAFLSLGSVISGAGETLALERINWPKSTYKQIKRDLLTNFSSSKYSNAEEAFMSWFEWWIRRYIDDVHADPERLASFISIQKPDCSEF